jgi:hypothetical protein
MKIQLVLVFFLKPKITNNVLLVIGMMKGYLKVFTYGFCHCEARIGVLSE